MCFTPNSRAIKKEVKKNGSLNLQKGAIISSYLAILISFIALLLDGIHYYEVQNTFQMWLNIAMLPIIMVAGFLIIWQKQLYKRVLIIALIPLLVNILVTIIDDSLIEPVHTFIIMRNIYTASVVMFLAIYIINQKLIYAISISISTTYVLASFLSGNEVLIENIFAVIFVQLSVVFVLDNFIRMYRILEKQAKDSELKVIQLSKKVEIERKDFIDKLSEIKSKFGSKDKDIVKEIDRLHQSMSSGITNMIFDYAEEKSKDDQLFFNRLLEEHPNLTPGDLRLCFLISTNITTKEIAEKTSRTSDSVRVLRSRLRKKLILSRTQNLYSYLERYTTVTKL